MALPPRGNRMPSHRFHTYCVCSPTESTLIACVLPQIFIVAEVSCLRRSKGSPTEYADLTEVFAENILPQISQNYTELLAECILPQISQNSRNFLLSLFSHRFHRFAQMVRAPSRGCTCLKCTNRARSTPTEQNRYSPTESTELTELLAERILPQISQIYTDG